MVITPPGHLGDQSRLLRVAMVQRHHLSHLIMSDRYIMNITRFTHLTLRFQMYSKEYVFYLCELGFMRM